MAEEIQNVNPFRMLSAPLPLAYLSVTECSPQTPLGNSHFPAQRSGPFQCFWCMVAQRFTPSPNLPRRGRRYTVIFFRLVFSTGFPILFTAQESSPSGGVRWGLPLRGRLCTAVLVRLLISTGFPFLFIAQDSSPNGGVRWGLPLRGRLCTAVLVRLLISTGFPFLFIAQDSSPNGGGRWGLSPRGRQVGVAFKFQPPE